MSSELQSMKYLPAGLLDPVTLPKVVGNQAAPEPSNSYAATGVGQWTGFHTLFSGLLGIMGGFGVLGGIWEIWSITSLESNLAIANELMAHVPELKASKLAIEAQLANYPLLMIMAVFRVALGVFFIIATANVKAIKEGANSMVAMVCGLALVYNLAVVYVAYLSLPDMASLPGMNEAAASVATTAAVGAMLFVVAIKFVFHGSIIAFMNTRNTKSLFTPRGPAIAPAGVTNTSPSESAFDGTMEESELDTLSE